MFAYCLYLISGYNILIFFGYNYFIPCGLK
nr:MAG TPA: hypothetical protein [Caudoviricetes sp.]